MKRREFIKLSSIATLPFVTSSINPEPVPININIYTTNRINLDKKTKQQIRKGGNRILKTLETPKTQVEPKIKFKNDNINIDENNKNNIEWTKRVYTSDNIEPASDTNILLLDNENSSVRGASLLGCGFCPTVSSGVIHIGKKLEKFKLDNINIGKPTEVEDDSTRAFRVLMHEIGHTLGLKHTDGKLWVKDDTVLSTIMTTDSNVIDSDILSKTRQANSFKREMRFNENIETILSRLPPLGHEKVPQGILRYARGMIS